MKTNKIESNQLNNMTNITIGNDLKQIENRSRKSIIDKSKTINKFQPIYNVSYINNQDSDSKQYQRTPNDNDRPMLEKYHKYNKELELLGEILPVMTYFAFVTPARNKNKFVLTNVVNEYGEVVASHIISNNESLKDYIYKLITFRALPYSYNSMDNTVKYSLGISKDSIEEIIAIPSYPNISKWNIFCNTEKIAIDKEFVQYKINEYIDMDESYKIEMLDDIEFQLNELSNDILGISNFIYPLIINIFLMRDNVNDLDVIFSYNKHINIVSTLVYDYIVDIKPKNYLEVLQVITYVVLTYMGYDMTDADSDNCKECFNELISWMNIKKEHVNYHLVNIKRNAGGVEQILNTIPDKYIYKPKELVDVARCQFVKRLLYK